MARSLIAPHKLAEMTAWLSTAAPPGDVVEVGVYRGGSLRPLAECCPARHVYGYDTFRGLPLPGVQDGDGFRGGEFGDTSLPLAAANLSGLPNVSLVRGLYPVSDTLRPSPVALAHVDVDLYLGTHEALQHLWPAMAPGGRIYCDDYGHEKCPGATAAIDEFADERGLTLILSGQWAYLQF